MIDLEVVVNSIDSRVVTIVANSLFLDSTEVRLDSRLIGELGAESIDFLDIVYRLEKEFSIKIPRDQIDGRAFAEGMNQDYSPSLFTVATFVRIVKEEFAASANASSKKPLNVKTIARKHGTTPVAPQLQPMSTY
jgi:acyl carrier protein